MKILHVKKDFHGFLLISILFYSGIGSLLSPYPAGTDGSGLVGNYFTKFYPQDISDSDRYESPLSWPIIVIYADKKSQ